MKLSVWNGLLGTAYFVVGPCRNASGALVLSQRAPDGTARPPLRPCPPPSMPSMGRHTAGEGMGADTTRADRLRHLDRAPALAPGS